MITLPTEVNELAVKVSANKQVEVQNVLQQIFTGTDDWEKQVDAIEVKDINGGSADILNYYDRSEGLSVIAIGGDKLSRGLTLEGLSVSYFLRASKMYDTLLQMGRWFGYRPGYRDLVRLYIARD